MQARSGRISTTTSGVVPLIPISPAAAAVRNAARIRHGGTSDDAVWRLHRTVVSSNCEVTGCRVGIGEDRGDEDMRIGVPVPRFSGSLARWSERHLKCMGKIKPHS
jgi:hypothetical protein